MAKKQFKAESKRLLDLMVNSIYTHKEIFLRELISNASDAIDKLYFRSLTDPSVGRSREDFCIRLTPDKEARTLTIEDNGCGMTKEELEENLGTIAHSGTLSFKEANKDKEELDVIGQFGVGFYSAFMVASAVQVTSRAFGAAEAWVWESEGNDGYTVKPAEMADCGTRIVLTLKEDGEEEKYSRFLEEYTLTGLIKKYSDYIRYPICMQVTKTVPAGEAGKEPETVVEDETLNSMVPLWRRKKSELDAEAYNGFYKEKFYDYEDPLLYIHTQAEGLVSYNALLYIPQKPPYDFYSKDYKRGLQLYTSNVMIMDRCEDLLPEYFGFVRGLVDSADLSLNISREMLQHDRQLKAIASNLKKKIQSELLKLLAEDREKYEKFFESFGLSLKYGVYAGYGMESDFLKDLLLYHSAAGNKLVSLKEYVDAMAENQTEIYYACGDSLAHLEKLPQAEQIRARGFDILFMCDNVDEFVVKILSNYAGKPFKSVTDTDLDVGNEEEKKAVEAKAEENKDLLARIKTALGDKVSDVRLTSRLKDSPVCLTSDGALSIEMEKVLTALPNAEGVKATRVLELNPDHPVFAALAALDDATLATYAGILYDQALLIAGLPLEDPAAYARSVCALMTK